MFQERLRQEIARSKRFNRPFVLAVLEAQRGMDSIALRERVAVALTIVRSCLREYDFCHKVFEDVLVAVLLETDLPGEQAALQRLAQRLIVQSGRWRVTLYPYPERESEIRSLPAVVAA
jgi:hypothetical protein